MMTKHLSSATIFLLAAFVVIALLAGLISTAAPNGNSAGGLLINLLLFYAVTTWWRNDRTLQPERRNIFANIFDIGFYFALAWPILISYYLLRTRAARGLILISALFFACSVPFLCGAILSALFTR